MKTANELSQQLAEKIHDIRIDESAGIFGTTNNEKMLLGLRKKAAELHSLISAGKDYGATMQQYEQVVADIDAAGLTGLISNDELTGYYTLIDELWAAIEPGNRTK